MELDKTFQMIVYEPEFKPMDINYLIERLPLELVYYLLFQYMDTKFGDYAFHDNIFNIYSDEGFGLSEDERTTTETILSKMGEHLFGYILIHPNLHPLLTSDITEVFQLQDTPSILISGVYDEQKEHRYSSHPEYYGFLSHLTPIEVSYNVGMSRNLEIANRSFGIYRASG
jgi:hypothetical protein